MIGLNDEGLRYAESGLPERREVVWMADQGQATIEQLAEGPLTQEELSLINI